MSIVLVALIALICQGVYSFSAVPSTFQFQGHDVYSEIAQPSNKPTLFSAKKPAVLLIHGFGCSTVYWRETVSSLTKAGYSVHALDLLGQGKSAKPGRAHGVDYSINLWAELVDSYAREKLPGEEVVLMGNSLGSLVALAAATGDFATNPETESFLRSRTQAICMFNCGIGLNSRNIIKEPEWNPIQRYLLTVTFDLFDALIFGNIPLLTYVLDKVVTRDLLRNALTGLYPCCQDVEKRVDDALVDSFYLPAKEEGSVEALSQIYTNDPGATPMQIHAKHDEFISKLPIHLVWGNQDGVTPLEGSVGQFYTSLANSDETNVSLDIVDSGHIPFDEVPDVSNGSMLEWLEQVGTGGRSSRAEGIKLPF